ncbi:hypothetical protein Tco_0920571, partial [Tanacetum coccineum]
MNKKSYSFDLDTFRNMLQIFPKLPGQHFVDTLFEEDILAFMRELRYSGTIKLLSDVKESEAYKNYHALATGKVQPKPKYVRRSSRTKTDEAPKSKATAKVTKSGKKKQPASRLETLFDIALTEA